VTISFSRINVLHGVIKLVGTI